MPEFNGVYSRRDKPKPRQPKKRVPSAEEIANDASLRWVDYRQGEALWSDDHQAELRFNGRTEDGKIQLATLLGIAPLPEPVAWNRVRRLTVMPDLPVGLNVDPAVAGLEKLNWARARPDN